MNAKDNIHTMRRIAALKIAQAELLDWARGSRADAARCRRYGSFLSDEARARSLLNTKEHTELARAWRIAAAFLGDEMRELRTSRRRSSPRFVKTIRSKP